MRESRGSTLASQSSRRRAFPWSSTNGLRGAGPAARSSLTSSRKRSSEETRSHSSDYLRTTAPRPARHSCRASRSVSELPRSGSGIGGGAGDRPRVSQHRDHRIRRRGCLHEVRPVYQTRKRSPPTSRSTRSNHGKRGPCDLERPCAGHLAALAPSSSSAPAFPTSGSGWAPSFRAGRRRPSAASASRSSGSSSPTGSWRYLLAWVKAVVTHDEGKPVRHDWNRSLSAERRSGPDTHPIEDIVITATILVGIVCTVWFLLFGSSGVPVAPESDSAIIDG